jgi:hypothetical protein
LQKEFTQALNVVRDKEELIGENQRKGLNERKNNEIRHHQIKDSRKVREINMRQFDCIKGEPVIIDRPISILLKCGLPEEIMVHPKPVKYLLIDRIVYHGPSQGDSIAYLGWT